MESLHQKGHQPPLMLIARIVDGRTVNYLNETLPLELQNELCAQAIGFRLPLAESLTTLLRAYGIQTEIGHYKTYVFPEAYARASTGVVRRYPRSHPLIKAFDFDQLADNVYAIEQNGAILAACVSARQNTEAAEAWVYTAPAYRRKGLAQLVVTAWAQETIQNGVVPFYSHKVENIASAGLADRLRLTPIFEEIGINAIA